LESWIKAGSPSEMREEAAYRLDFVWWEDRSRTSLNFSDLPLRDLPETLKLLPNLQQLRIRGESLRDIRNAFFLPIFCYVEIIGEISPEVASQLQKAHCDPNYKGAKFITSDSLSDPEHSSLFQSKDKGKAPQHASYAPQSYKNVASKRLSITKDDAFQEKSIPLTLTNWNKAGAPEEKRHKAFERIVNCLNLPRLITSLDLSDLPLCSLPPTLGELNNLEKLQLLGTHLNDLSPIFKLPTSCEIFILGEMNEQLFNATEAIINAANYKGPTLLAAVPTVIANERKAAAYSQKVLQQLTDAAKLKKYRSRILAIFKNRCDICYQHANPSIDIVLPKKSVLQRTPLLHDKCFIEQFPLKADENLSLKSRRWFNPRITLDSVHQSMYEFEQFQRKKSPYLQVIQRLLTLRDMSLSPQQKIDLFLRAAILLEAENRLQIGNRSLSKAACLTRALEIALHSSRNNIPKISGLFLEIMPSETSKFIICGISYNRSQLDDWSQNRNLPNKSRSDSMAAKLEKLMHEKSEAKRKENVENSTIRQSAIARLNMIIDRVVNLKTIVEVHQAIQEYIHTNSSNKKEALAGLNIVAKNVEMPSYFHHRVQDALAIVWSYIEDTSSEVLRTNLKNALVSRLIEIAVEERTVYYDNSSIILPPCPNGQIQRLINVPEGIDFSICSGLSIEHLKEELSQLASSINSEFEEEWGNYADILRKNFSNAFSASDIISEDPDVIISEIKRDMFFAKVKTILIEQRGLDPDIVIQEANLIFPKGLVL